MGDVLVNAADPLTPSQFEDHAPPGVPRAELFLFWIGGVIVCAILAYAFQTPIKACAVFTALALGPGLVGLLLLPRWGEIAAKPIAIAVWIAAVTAGCAATGGAGSAAALAYVAPLALAWRWGGREAHVETAAFCAIGLILAALTAAHAPPPLAVGGLAVLGAMLALVFSVVVGAAPISRSPPASGAQAIGLALIAHELRTPLTHIIGFADLMAQRVFGPLPDAYKDYPGLIAAAGRHQLDLVNTLVDFGRLEAGQYPFAPELIDPRQSVLEVTEGAQAGARAKGLDLTADCESAPGAAHLDPRAWRQILYNLIGNAVKFTPEGGSVKVRLTAPAGALTLTVADSGPGLSEAEKARVGKLFARSGSVNSIEGAGIGLALTMGLVRLHHGAMRLDDAPGGGLLVRVEIPEIAPA